MQHFDLLLRELDKIAFNVRNIAESAGYREGGDAWLGARVHAIEEACEQAKVILVDLRSNVTEIQRRSRQQVLLEAARNALKLQEEI